MKVLKQHGLRIFQWFEKRTGLLKPLEEMARHPTPSSAASWWYVFGSAAMVLLILQVVTGVLLALVYSPSASNAYASLQFINHNLRLGWFLRAMHGWGSDFMIAIVLIHMMQVFLFGAYKYPRELTWIAGVFLLLLTLGMAFTGQVLRFDQDAYWGLGIGASVISRIPFAGAPMVHLLLGGPIIGGATLSRFFALHVFLVPALLLAFVGLHLLMVLRLGINEWPMPGRLVRKSDYDRNYAALTKSTGVPFVPDAAWKDAVFAAVILLAVMACAFFFGPFGPGGQPDPAIIQTVPHPDFFFLWLYAVLAFLPPEMETPALLIAPVAIVGGLLLLPLVAGEGEKHWSRRPVAVPHGHADRGHAGHIHSPGPSYAVESGDGFVVQRSRAGVFRRASDPAGTARRIAAATEAVPQLPFHWRRGRKARPRSGCGCNRDDRGPDRSPDPAGRRQYAGLRQGAQPGRNHRHHAVPANAARAGIAAGGRCFAGLAATERLAPG